MEPYLGQIDVFGFNFAPRGWMECNGQILPINQNQSLYSLLGTIYGGDGRTSFALPDLRGRASMHFGDGYSIGAKSGEETHTLISQELAPHNHQVRASTEVAKATSPKSALYAKGINNVYNSSPNTPMNANIVGKTGGGQAHNNMQPYLVVTWCIAVQGLFPPRS